MRKLDAAIAKLLDLNVVADDWPCGYYPDGCNYEAALYLEEDRREGWHGDYVYANKSPNSWPPNNSGGYMVAHVTPVPFYSTSPDAVQLVIEYMTSKGYDVITAQMTSGQTACMMFLGTAASYPPKDLFLHLYTIEVSRTICARVQATTIYRAICLAALLVSGLDITEYLVEGEK